MSVSQLYFITKAGSSGEVYENFSALEAVYPRGSKAVATGVNDHPLVCFPEDEDGFADFAGVMPELGTFKLSIYWTSDADSGDVLWQVSFERDNATLTTPQANLNVNSFAPPKTVLDAAPSAVGLIRKSSIVFTPAEAAGVLPLEPYRMRVRRDAGQGLDTLQGDAQLLCVTFSK